MRTVILITFDEEYFTCAAVFLKSLSDNYNGSALDVVCLVTEELLSAESKFKSLIEASNLNVKFTRSPAEGDLLVDGDNYLGWTNEMVWYRLIISDVLQEYDKVIYFDVDMLVLRDIQPILEYPMYQKFMATLDLSAGDIDILGWKDYAYFNAGMFIADLNWWRESGIENKFRDYISTQKKTAFAEQDAMNILLKDVWGVLPISFNFYYFVWDEYGIPDWDQTILRSHAKDPLVVHYVGSVKPWNYLDVTGKEDVSKFGTSWFTVRESLKD